MSIALVLDGSLDLLGDNTDPLGNTFTLEALGDDISWGSPDAVTRTIDGWLADGMRVEVDGLGNRELSVSLRITAADAAGLAAGEAALKFCCYRKTSLSWTPPTVDAPTSVFEVEYASIEPTYAFGGGDLDENRLTRHYILTLTAYPFTRSVDLVKFAAIDPPSGSPTTVTIDACSAITGWAGTVQGSSVTPRYDSGQGAVVVDFTTIASRRTGSGLNGGAPRYRSTLTKTFSTVTMTSTPYLKVQMWMPGTSWVPKVFADGTALELVASDGMTRYYKCPSFTVLEVIGDFYTKRAGAAGLWLFDVSRTDTIGVGATGHESARSVFIDGSSRTFGSIAVSSDAALADTVVYTVPSSPAGYTPGMQRYQTAGPAPSVDATAVSGFKQAIDYTSKVAAGLVDQTFTIPADQLVEATYGVLARVKVATPGDYYLVVSASVMRAGVGAGPIGQVTRQWTAPDTSWHMVWIDSFTLPPSALPAESQLAVDVFIGATPVTGGPDSDPVYVDEFWLFNLTDGAVTVLSAGDCENLFLDSPDDDRDYPVILTGHESDRSDAVAVGLSQSVISFGRHLFTPGLMDMFVVTTGAVGPSVSVEHYMRWHTHAAR